MNIFQSIPRGDSRTWNDDPVQLADGRLADSTAWGLQYVLVGPSALGLIAAANGDGTWTTTLTPVASGALLEGPYVWSAVLTNSTERITAVSGALSITTDLSSATAPFDGRTTAQIALAKCESAMATFNASGGKVKRYEIAGRILEFATIGELMALHSFWQMKVLGEGGAASIANGQGNPRKLYTRFVSVSGPGGLGGNGGIGYP